MQKCKERNVKKECKRVDKIGREMRGNRAKKSKQKTLTSVPGFFGTVVARGGENRWIFHGRR